MPENTQPVTQWLADWRNGDRAAGDRLFAAVYDELRRIAATHMDHRERGDHTLAPTAVVHELYLKFFDTATPLDAQSRAHFLSIAVRQLRNLLIDHARARLAGKREGHRARLSVTDVSGLIADRDEQLMDLSIALDRLSSLDERAARVVELRYFGGLTEPATAEALGISVATVKRDWEFARAWLHTQLASTET